MNKPTVRTGPQPLASSDARLPAPHARNILVTLLISFLAGLALTLAHPPANLFFVAYLAIIPLIKLFPFQRKRIAFIHGFVFGLAYFCGMLYWIAVFAATKIGGFGLAAWFILSARESLWIGVFAVGVNSIWTKVGWFWRAISIASVWAFCEWIRQLGPLGFGWCDLAYSQWKCLPMIQIAALTGIWGVSWLIVFVNAMLAEARWRAVATGVVVTGLVILVGHYVSNRGRAFATTNVSALQADIFEDVPYDGLRPTDLSYFYGTLKTFDQMAATAKKANGSTICVTAETSIPGYPTLDPELRQILAGIARTNDVTMIVGSRGTDIASAEDTNSVFAFGPSGAMSEPYNKQQLVPFGEYVPYRKQMPFLDSFHVLDYDMAPGKSDQPPIQTQDNTMAGIAVCYESTYPRFMREQVARGATYDVVVTDDAWYGRTAAAEQHLAMSILRAVETDRYLVRCASTGISAIIEPNGKIDKSAPLFTKRVLSGTIGQIRYITPFVRWGDWWIAVCSFQYLITLILAQAKPKATAGRAL